jgi:hypothetical protein
MGLLSLENDQETPCPERHELDEINEMVPRLNGELFPQEHYAKQCSPS